MRISTQSGASARRSRLRRIIGKAMFACAGGVLLLAAAQAHAAAVVTDSVVSQSTGSQASVPVTFGQIFKAGDIPAGSTVTATLNGQPVPLQVDAKATNPDGSLRHAVLTAIVPSLPGGSTLPLALSSGSLASSMARGAPVSLSQLLATNYDAKASLNIGGTIYSVNARGLLQAADLSGSCGTWERQCNVWLAGPLTSEWVVNGPLTSANGATNPNIRIYFAVRAYAGTTPGTVGSVRTDIIVENTSAFAPQAQPQYTATLTSGSASFTSPALTQYAYTRWHQVLWWNNAQPQVYLQQDTQYIQASGAVSRYMNLRPDEAFLSGLRQSCAPLDNCDQTKAMSNVGAQPAIGPLPRWTSVYIVYPDVRAYNWMIANTDALGTYSIHYRDQQTGWPTSIRRHPYATIIGWAYAHAVAPTGTATGTLYKADLLPGCVNNSIVTTCGTAWYSTGNPYAWDNAHQPAESYVPYMVTGSYYYMSELAFGASHNEIWSNPAYRGFSLGLIDDAHSQVRGKAWVLREMADAAYLLPDNYPLKAEFNADVMNSLNDWNTKYTNNPKASPLGIPTDSTTYSLNGGLHNAIAPWQHNFLVWSAGHAADLGFAGAAEFRNWLAKFEVGVMTDWWNNPTYGYCWLEASTYAIPVKDSSNNWLQSFSAIYAARFPTLLGLTCNSPAMVSAVGTIMHQRWQVGEMSGYANSATGYPANFQIGIAAAVDSGLPNAMAAWNLFQSRSVQPAAPVAYNNYPNFAVLPRSTSSSTTNPVPPPTNPIPPPTNTTPPPTNTTPPPTNTTSPPVNPTPAPVTVQSSTATPNTPTVTVAPPPATPDPAVKASPAPVQVDLSPASLQTRAAIPIREFYLGVERGLDTAFRTMRYFVGLGLSQVPLTTRSVAAQSVALPTRRASATPTPASLPIANPTETGLALAAPNRPIASDSYLSRASGAGSIQRR